MSHFCRVCGTRAGCRGQEWTMNSAKCCFCNADILNVIRWRVVVQEINAMGVYAQEPNRKQLRNVCNYCMDMIKAAMDEIQL